MDEIINLAAKVFNVDRATLLGRSRKRCDTRARQAAVWAIRISAPETTLESLGEVFGRDHTTIRWAIEAAEARAMKEPRYAFALADLLPTALVRCRGNTTRTV